MDGRDAMSADAFQQLADLLPEAMLLIDGRGVVHAANRAAAALLNEPAGAIAGRRLSQCVFSSEEEVAQLLRAGARSRTLVPGALVVRAGDAALACRCDAAVLRPRSAEHEPLVMLRLVRKEPTVTRFQALNERIDALSREVARRRAAEAQLHAYGERLRVTLSSIGDAMIATDERACITMINGVAQALTGWSEADAVGLPVHEVFVIVNEHTRQPVDNPLVRVLREGRVVGLANHTVLIARDGSERPIDDSGAPIRDADGRLVGAVLVFRDITERYAMERALQRQTQKLIESDRRKDEFLSMLAHELRNPLAPLHNGVHLLLSGRLAGEGVQRIAQMLRRQLNHMTRLVDDLLDVARLTRGHIELKKAPVALDQLLQQAVEMSRPLLEARQHVFDAQPVPATWLVNADSTRMVQVFANLLGNATKFTPPQGRIALECAANGSDAVIAVRDNGVGIEPDLLPQVFDLFVQGDCSLDRHQGGLGIGLTIVRTLVEMHGGTVHVRSDGVGRGSEFVVRLPLHAGPDTVDSERRPAA